MADYATPAPDAQPPGGKFGELALIEVEKVRARRARVLAHPDIAAHLSEAPYNLPQPAMWNGYIPPAQIPYGGGYKPNPSPIRRQLLDIVRAVAEREQAAEGGE